MHFTNDLYAYISFIFRSVSNRVYISTVCLRNDDTLVIVYNPEFSNIRVCMEVLLKPKLWDKVQFVELKGPTRGAAETVLLGLQGLSEDLQQRPVLLCDGDTFYTTDVVNQYREVAKHGRNAVFCFKDDQTKVQTL